MGKLFYAIKRTSQKPFVCWEQIQYLILVFAVTGAQRGGFRPAPGTRAEKQDVVSNPQDEGGERQNTTGVQEEGTQISGPQGGEGGGGQAAAKEGKKDIIKCNEQF